MQRTYGICGFLLLAAVGCGAASDDAQASSPGASGSAGSSSASSAGDTTGATTTIETTGSGPVSSLSFDVTTAAQGGRYSPKNVGAIWIEDGSGAYVRSLEVWAGIRKHDLQQYVASLGGNSDSDVVTSATLSQHRAHHVSWDLKNKSGATMPAGSYQLLIDVTDREGDGQTLSIPFDTSAGTQNITPAGSSYYKTMSLLLE